MAKPHFSGGDALNAKIKELSGLISNASGLQVGYFAGSTETRSPDDLPSATAAFWAEYGTKTEPPRPTFRTMIADQSPGWGNLLEVSLKRTGFDASQALEIVGIDIAGALQDQISNTFSPALSPITVMLRHMRSEDQSLIVTGATVGEAARRVAAGESNGGASTKPLIDSGDMYNAVGYKVTTP